MASGISGTRREANMVAAHFVYKRLSLDETDDFLATHLAPRIRRSSDGVENRGGTGFDSLHLGPSKSEEGPDVRHIPPGSYLSDIGRRRAA